MKVADNFEEYAVQFPTATQAILKKLRSLVKAEAPNSDESISYGMPAYNTFKKPLVYFAAYEKHIGLYATPSPHSEFTEELAKYKQGKGSVQFPLDQPMPYDLIKRIIEFRVMENLEKYAKK